MSRLGILLMVCLSTYLFLELLGGHSLQVAYACQCSSRTPQDYDRISDVIFIGRVADKNYDVPIERAMHVTFNASKSWKGIDTELTTVHIDNYQCQTPLIDDQEYLVYAYRDFFEVRMQACSGSSLTENQDIIGDDLIYLDANYEPIRIVEGHTNKVNFLPVMQITGSLIGISVVAYVILVRYR